MSVVATIVDQAKDAATKVTSVVKGLELGDKLQVYVVGPVHKGASKVPELASGAAAAIGKASKVTVDVLAIYVVTPATNGGEYVLQLVKGIAPAEIVNKITATLLSAITAVKCAIAPVQRDIVAMYQHVQTRVFVSGMDYLMQNQRARIAAQAACAAATLTLAGKLYYASSAAGPGRSTTGQETNFVDSGMLKEKEHAGEHALEEVGVKPGDVVMVATQAIEAVELYTFCSAAKAKVVVLGAGQSLAAASSLAVSHAPKVFVYDTRVMPGATRVEAAMKAAGLQCQMIFVAGEREKKRLLAAHPSHLPYAQLVEQGLAKARSSGGRRSAKVQLPDADSLVGGINHGINSGLQALGSLFSPAPKAQRKSQEINSSASKGDNLVRL